MAPFRRSTENPVLLPNRENMWEHEAAFNGCPTKDDGRFRLLYRAVSLPHEQAGATLEVSSIGEATSRDGVHFKNRRQLIKPDEEWERYGCEDPRVTKLEGKYFIFYTALSTHPFTPEGIRVGLAITKDFKTIESKHLVTPFNAKAMALFPEKIGGRYAAVLTPHTDIPPAKIALAFFEREEDMWSPHYWAKWLQTLEAHSLPLRRSENDQIEVGAPPVKTKYGWVLLYAYIKDYFTSSRRLFGIEAALLGLADPRKVLARTYKPILTPQEEYEEFGRVPHVIFPSGAFIHRKTLSLYYGATDTTTCLATAPLADFMEELFIPQLAAANLERFSGNPILHPVPAHGWEAKAVFNPGALLLQGSVHLLYRAMSDDHTSSLGYAKISDGVRVEERLPDPVYAPRADFEKKLHAGNSGVEDPRLTELDGTIYMCYTAFDGEHPPRVALTSIARDDFLNKRWKWNDPKLISPPALDDKDACVFPEKIGGKFLFIHRIGSNILLDAVDDLGALGETKWLEGKAVMKPRPDSWDSKKIGLGPPPVKTKRGWLLIYHGISETSHKYRVGAALLDLKDPTRVIARAQYPILEPEMEYEREGQVPNVVFPCGLVVLGNTLFVYYGGADKVVGVATAPLVGLLRALR